MAASGSLSLWKRNLLDLDFPKTVNTVQAQGVLSVLGGDLETCGWLSIYRRGACRPKRTLEPQSCPLCCDANVASCMALSF